MKAIFLSPARSSSGRSGAATGENSPLLSPHRPARRRSAPRNNSRNRRSSTITPAQQPRRQGHHCVDVPIVTLDVVATRSAANHPASERKLPHSRRWRASNHHQFLAYRSSYHMVVLMQFSGTLRLVRYYAKYWPMRFPQSSAKDWWPRNFDMKTVLKWTSRKTRTKSATPFIVSISGLQRIQRVRRYPRNNRAPQRLNGKKSILLLPAAWNVFQTHSRPNHEATPR